MTGRGVGLGEAILELRRVSGLNQQYFATKLKMSTRALSTYEGGRIPKPKQLLAFWAESHELKRPDLAELFHLMLVDELQPPPGCRISLGRAR